MANYDIFTGKELEIADRIQKLRLCILVHSCIYYHLNGNIVSDAKWDKWAKELVIIQRDYPDISKQVCWYDAFKDWDASTGAFLPITDDWVVMKAKRILGGGKIAKENVEPTASKSKTKNKKSARKSLF